MSILSVRDVSKSYGNHVALDKISLEIPENSIYGLLGPNGAGKTSLIRIINHITAPDSGTVFYQGQPSTPADVNQIGYLPEERGLYPKMKVGEQVLYLAQLKGLNKAEATRKMKEWFERFEIMDWYNKKIESLSKGMAQKVQFVTTVLHDPKLLIFDEPFTGFDPINTNIIKEEIRRLKDEGATVIFSTHRMESVEEICDQISLINNSKKVLEGSIKNVKAQYKRGIYTVCLDGDVTIESRGDMKIHELTHDDGHTMVRVSGKEESPNGILNYFAAKGKIISFEEEIPSLNDIFIEKVQEYE